MQSSCFLIVQKEQQLPGGAKIRFVSENESEGGGIRRICLSSTIRKRGMTAGRAAVEIFVPIFITTRSADAGRKLC